MRTWHVPLNVPPGGPGADLAAVDAALGAAGSLSLAGVDVGADPLEEDGDHLT